MRMGFNALEEHVLSPAVELGAISCNGLHHSLVYDAAPELCAPVRTRSQQACIQLYTHLVRLQVQRTPSLTIQYCTCWYSFKRWYFAARFSMRMMSLSSFFMLISNALVHTPLAAASCADSSGWHACAHTCMSTYLRSPVVAC